jgi:hypothetical protein
MARLEIVVLKSWSKLVPRRLRLNAKLLGRFMRLSHMATMIFAFLIFGAAGCSRASDLGRATTAQAGQAVIIHLDSAAAPGGKLTPAVLADLEENLGAIINRLGLGEFDGDEIAVDGSAATLYMYGPEADRLFSGIESTLRASQLSRKARVELRYGAPGSKIREIRL